MPLAAQLVLQQKTSEQRGGRKAAHAPWMQVAASLGCSWGGTAVVSLVLAPETWAAPAVEDLVARSGPEPGKKVEPVEDAEGAEHAATPPESLVAQGANEEEGAILVGLGGSRGAVECPVGAAVSSVATVRMVEQEALPVVTLAAVGSMAD